MMRGHLLRAVVAAILPRSLLDARRARRPPVQVDHVDAEHLRSKRPSKPGTTVWVAIRQVIAPGWHTYWRNPGDSGLATSITWLLPKGVTAGTPLWPAPRALHDRLDRQLRLSRGKPHCWFRWLSHGMRAIDITGRRMSSLCSNVRRCAFPNRRHRSGFAEGIGNPRIFARARAALPRVFGGIARAEVTATALTVSLEDPSFAETPSRKCPHLSGDLGRGE